LREGLAPDDYGDPGPYKNPEGTVAYEFKGNAGEAVAGAPKNTSNRAPAAEFKVVKPGGQIIVFVASALKKHLH